MLSITNSRWPLSITSSKWVRCIINSKWAGSITSSKWPPSTIRKCKVEVIALRLRPRDNRKARKSQTNPEIEKDEGGEKFRLNAGDAMSRHAKSRTVGPMSVTSQVLC